MGVEKGALAMPVRAKPYKHQQEAFDFCCRVFGLLEEGGDSGNGKGGGEGGEVQSNSKTQS
ncbi:MAG: hypothetical protein IIZ39_03545 [Blautia sp.]|nr:hypothetical protein [Blautia sp.]